MATCAQLKRDDWPIGDFGVIKARVRLTVLVSDPNAYCSLGKKLRLFHCITIFPIPPPQEVGRRRPKAQDAPAIRLMSSTDIITSRRSAGARQRGHVLEREQYRV
jgi:hypothetical protein